MDKLKTLPQLRKIVAAEKARGKTIVLANGGFDLFHVGHIRYLEEARSKGDVLVVAINSDSSVRRLKGRGRPILRQSERAEILAAFSFVDYVTIFRELNVEKILLALKPDFHVKGSDYKKDTVPEKETVKMYGGKVAIAGGPKIRNTSEIIKKITASLSPSSEPSPPGDCAIMSLRGSETTEAISQNIENKEIATLPLVTRHDK